MPVHHRSAPVDVVSAIRADQGALPTICRGMVGNWKYGKRACQGYCSPPCDCSHNCQSFKFRRAVELPKILLGTRSHRPFFLR